MSDSSVLPTGHRMESESFTISKSKDVINSKQMNPEFESKGFKGDALQKKQKVLDGYIGSNENEAVTLDKTWSVSESPGNEKDDLNYQGISQDENKKFGKQPITTSILEGDDSLIQQSISSSMASVQEFLRAQLNKEPSKNQFGDNSPFSKVQSIEGDEDFFAMSQFSGYKEKDLDSKATKGAIAPPINKLTEEPLNRHPVLQGDEDFDPFKPFRGYKNDLDSVATKGAISRAIGPITTNQPNIFNSNEIGKEGANKEDITFGENYKKGNNTIDVEEGDESLVQQTIGISQLDSYYEKGTYSTQQELYGSNELLTQFANQYSQDPHNYNFINRFSTGDQSDYQHEEDIAHTIEDKKNDIWKDVKDEKKWSEEDLMNEKRKLFEIEKQKLIKNIMDFMNDPTQNPRKGSIPSERVQNCVKHKYTDLYNNVVGYEYGNQWHKFINANPEYFELINTIDEGKMLPRIRLRSHERYYEADAEELRQRNNRDRTIVECLKLYLSEHNDDVRVEDFINDYKDMKHHEIDPQLPKGELAPQLPRFRDMQRIVKRYPHLFSYDHEGGKAGPRIRTASTWQPPPNRIKQNNSTYGPDSDIPSEFYDRARIPQLDITRSVTDPTYNRFSNTELREPATPRELKLVEHIEKFLYDPNHNPHKGSVPSERVQNCIKASNADLYKTVVGTRYSNQWHKFIHAHKDLFHLFFVSDEKRSVWRIRLIAHSDYKNADENEKKERDQKEQDLLKHLVKYLQLHNNKSTVDEFRTNFIAEGKGDATSLPARGDFVRFVRRHSEYFVYDSHKYEITLKSTTQHHKNENRQREPNLLLNPKLNNPISIQPKYNQHTEFLANKPNKSIPIISPSMPAPLARYESAPSTFPSMQGVNFSKTLEKKINERMINDTIKPIT